MTYEQACRKAIKNANLSDRAAAPHYKYRYTVCESGERIGIPYLVDWTVEQEHAFWSRVSRYVVSEGYGAEREYSTANEFELDTFHAGAAVVFEAA